MSMKKIVQEQKRAIQLRNEEIKTLKKYMRALEGN